MEHNTEAKLLAAVKAQEHGAHYALFLACGRGWTNAVRTLLPAMKWDDRNGELIGRASLFGHAQIVELLLANGRSDPRAGNSWALLAASEEGHGAVVRALLADGRANPYSTRCLQEASKRAHLEVVKALLADGRADPCAGNSESLMAACEHGHLQVVQALLADGRADPRTNGCYPLWLACWDGHVQVVRALLADCRGYCRAMVDDVCRSRKQGEVLRACVRYSTWFTAARHHN